MPGVVGRMSRSPVPRTILRAVTGSALSVSTVKKVLFSRGVILVTVPLVQEAVS
jgi:hypothetical protein